MRTQAQATGPELPRSPSSESAAAPEPEPALAANLTVEAVSARWADIRAAVRNGSDRGKSLELMLSAATVQAVSDGVIVLGHPIAPLVGRLSDPALILMFNGIFSEIFGGVWQVQIVHAPGGQAAPANSTRAVPPRQQSKRQEFTRPSRVGQAADRARAVDDGPPPPEPPPEPEEPWPAPKPDEDLTDAERDEMVATAHDGTPDERLDPDQVALELLKAELGARPIEGG